MLDCPTILYTLSLYGNMLIIVIIVPSLPSEKTILSYSYLPLLTPKIRGLSKE